LLFRSAVSGRDLIVPCSSQTTCRCSVPWRDIMSEGPLEMLEGMFVLVMTSPDAGDSAVMWRVYDENDLASPMTYIAC
jgi:hypothetical protein